MMALNIVDVPVRALKGISLKMFETDQQTRFIQTYGGYERYTLATILSGVEKGIYQNFVDIGASIGYYTTIFAKVSAKGKVFAYEPNPDVINVLKHNIQKNNLNNVKISQIALGRKSGEITLYSTHQDTGRSTVHQIPNYSYRHKVRMSTLDDELFRHAKNRIDLIKVDIQGFDLEAIDGAKKILKRDLPDILFEFCPCLIVSDRGKIHELFSFLDGEGYQPYFYRGHDISCLEFISYEILMKFFDLYRQMGSKGYLEIYLSSKFRSKERDY